MKIISKRISRNEFISRKNGVIPSLVDMWIIPETQLNCGGSESYVFNTYPSAAAKMRELGQSPSLLEYKAEFVYQDHNYGLIVSDIIIPESAEIIDENGEKIIVELSKNITDYTDIYVNIPIEDKDGEYYDLNNKSSKVHYEGRKIISGGTEIKILTYSSLNKWYTFFKSYFRTIKMYDNAIGLYNAECINKHEDNMKYFKDLDDLFKARGGKNMYFWIVQYCMPHENDYDDDETNDLQVKETFPTDVATNSASYVIPILLTNSIDDLGEMTIFSTKWKDGVDYHNRAEEIGKCDRTHKDEYNPQLKEFIDCNKQKDDQCFGTVVDRPYKYESDDIGKFDERYLDIDYETYMIKSGSETSGYCQNSFKENEFKPEDWVNYTDWDICNNPDKYSSFLSDGKTCVSEYAYSPINGAIIYNPKEDFEKQVIDYTAQDYILSNGEYIEVIDGYYTTPVYSVGYMANVVFKRGIKLPVIEDGALKYAELNGRRFYVVKDGDIKKIYFTKKSNCQDPGSIVNKGKYILYNGSVFPLYGGNIVKIDNGDEEFRYQIFNGYFGYKGVTYFVKGNNVGLPVTDVIYDGDKKITIVKFEPLDDKTLSTLGWKSVSVNPETGNVTICHKLDIKKANLITGYTDSKLDLLRRRKINTDEMGTELPGYLDLGLSSEFDGYEIGVEKIEIPILCEEGIEVTFNVSEKVKIDGSNLNTPYDQCVLDILYKVGEVSGLEYQTTTKDGKKLYNGNYLEKIVFYYLDENGGRLNETFVSGSDSREVLKKYDEGGEYYRPTEILYCDITYYIGATLEYDEENSRYIPSTGRHKGVKYVDTLIVTKSVGDFYMSDGSFFTFNYYQLRGNMSDQYLDDFKDNKLVNMSYFEMETMIFCNKEGDLFKTDYWENNNGMISAPVFRTEYNLFSSTPQKSKSDIYIDRGISSAFETHIKLQEVHTLDALENYSNGYFKINEY